MTRATPASVEEVEQLAPWRASRSFRRQRLAAGLLLLRNGRSESSWVMMLLQWVGVGKERSERAMRPS